MTQWTPSARLELENHLAGLRRSLDGSGADADEVLDDVRRHVDDEAAAARLPLVTEADVRRFLERVAPLDGWELNSAPIRSEKNSGARSAPDSAAVFAGSRENPGPPREREPTLGQRFWTLALWLLGVLLPVITLGFEVWTRACAQEFFDPIPTLWHGLLVGLVPVANLLLLLRPATASPAALRLRAALGAAGLGISTAYAVLFLPLTPFALFGVIFGVGLLPLSPLLRSSPG